MASKAEYLKKYLRPKGNAHSSSKRAPGSTGALRLMSDDEEDGRGDVNKKGKKGASTPGRKKSLFQVLRQAPDGSKYLFKDEDAEELLESDDDEVHVVGADGQTLALSEADKKKVAKLIAEEEGRGVQEFRRPPSPIPQAAAPLSDKWKAAFSLEGALLEAAPPAPAPSLYGSRSRAEWRKGADDGSPSSFKDSQSEQHQQECSFPSSRTQPGGQDEDLSPPRKGHDKDLSPPRRRRSRDISSAGNAEQHRDLFAASRTQEKDSSPPRKRRGADVVSSKREREEDLSPLRRGQAVDTIHARIGSDKDLLSKREKDIDENKKDLSPPRRGQDKDSSPPRRPRTSSSALPGPEAER